MIPLIGAQTLSKSYGIQKLFENLSFTLHKGDRVGLIGPNGSGKSTLLKILVGIEEPGRGSISKKQNLHLGYASQMPTFPSVSVEEVLTGGHDHLLTRARILLGKAKFQDFYENADTLSGGWRKRLDILRALMLEPDFLLLDEPTNHLDLEGIEWLEKFLLREVPSFLVVSHDRMFLTQVTNKIIEINPCFPKGLLVIEGNYTRFIEHKTAFLEAQCEEQKGLASTLRGELEWLKRSPKARTTKSQARIRQAHAMMSELSDLKRRNKIIKVDLDFQASERETRKLLVAKNLSKTLGGKTLFKGIDVLLSPGTRLGILGENGSGKTTLLKILAGEVKQDVGTVKYADDLKLIYFDQHKETIPDNITLREALSPYGDHVNYQGLSIHVNGWAKKFLFSPDRLELPVHCLSGGERARILIARLMQKPADILFLDEPTNDLDIPTLEVLERSLEEFVGAVVLISHDRSLMENLCTELLVLSLEETPPEEIKKETLSSINEPKQKKLSYKEQKELEGMEANILLLEEEIAILKKKLENPEVHADAKKSLELYQILANSEKKLESLFLRWEELNSDK